MTLTIRTLSASEAAQHLDDLARLLQACVADGASVGFVMPFDVEEAAGFWQDGVLPALAGQGRVLWGAFEEDRLVGTVQLGLEMMPNQSHRAEVSKMLVAPAVRRRGLGIGNSRQGHPLLSDRPQVRSARTERPDRRRRQRYHKLKRQFRFDFSSRQKHVTPRAERDGPRGPGGRGSRL